MTERILDFSEEPAKLSVRTGLLVVRRGSEEVGCVPLAEIAVIVVSHPQVVYTHSVLTGCAAARAAFVVCDERHLPTGMLLPLDAHYVQAERFAMQAAVHKPVKKRTWQQIVRAKLRCQARTLEALCGDDGGLHGLLSRVRSGDPTNVEAQAGRRYWRQLFGDTFRRDRHAADANRLLNYGYAVLRAVIARAVVAAGLHPSLGIHHCNRYSSFCLADDLMEPFRPLVDRTVQEIVDERGADVEMDSDVKRALIAPMMARYEVDGQQLTFFETAARCAHSLVAVMEGKTKRLVLPEL